tara:strand:+ start:21471 stop:21998 length:528 start_codon:yes stop_codon:yes gene_type:complete
MFAEIVNKIKEVLKIEQPLLLTVTKEQVVNSIRNVLLKEIIQLTKMNKEVQENNENYKLNLSQFYLIHYSSKKNDVNMDMLKMYLEINNIVKNIENKDISNKEIIKKVIDNIDMEELNKDRIEKFMYEFEQIVQVFSLDESKKLDLLDNHKKSVFNQYVDTFIKNNGKIEKYLKS